MPNFFENKWLVGILLILAGLSWWSATASAVTGFVGFGFAGFSIASILAIIAGIMQFRG